jgi:anti-sigma-K factor RskA
MKHDDPKLIDALAAEFVLGTLGGRARRRFERWRSKEWHVERRVQAWEERLAGLALRLTPMRPSPHVWANIEKRIGATAAPGTRPTRGTTPPIQTRTSSWRPLAAAAAILVVLVGGFLAWRVTQPNLHDDAVIAAANAPAPSWRVQVDDGLTHMRLVALGGAAPRAGKSFELWALPDNGGAPVSLGLLPTSGRLDRELTDAQRIALQGASKVAVSVEPEGGSRTGLPTGPVEFVADRIKRA